MTKQELAQTICTELTPEEWGEMASILFDKVEQTYSATQVNTIYNQLLAAGVDVGPICKKKHPQ